MYNNTTSEVQITPAPGILSSHAYIIALIPKTALGLLAALMGIVTNSVCIHVFLKMKNKDAVSISFLGLASSDLTLSIFTFSAYTLTGLTASEGLHGPQSRIDPFLIYVFVGTASICVNEVTILITLYVAIARCLCVTMPIRFKYNNMFTPSQTRGYIIGAWVFSVGIYIPIFANMGAQEVYNPALNTTRYVVWFSADREKIKDGVFLLIQTIIPFSTQVILILCIAVMVKRLVDTKKFRQSAISTSSDTEYNDHSNEQLKAESGGVEQGHDTGKKNTDVSGKLSGKELQAVKQVVLISVIFVVCNIPMILVTLLSALVPGLDSRSTSRYGRLYVILHGYKRIFEQINSSINLFVYYKFNSKFRVHCNPQASLHKP